MDGLYEGIENGNVAEQEESIIEKCKKFLKRASDRWCSDIDDQELALEVAGGNFWGVGENKKRWAILDNEGKDLIPTIPYNNISPQVNAIASPFSTYFDDTELGRTRGSLDFHFFARFLADEALAQGGLIADLTAHEVGFHRVDDGELHFLVHVEVQ